MKYISILILALFTAGYAAVLKAEIRNDSSGKAEYIHRAVKQVTDVIVYDIYSPPVASRIYAYACIAGYEAAIQNNPAYVSLAGQLLQLKEVPRAPGKVNAELAAVQAILSVARALIISEDKIISFSAKLLKEYKQGGMPEQEFNASLEYGDRVAAHVLEWAALDNYRQTRSLARYAVSDDASTWKPTPPAYIKAIEPHWSKMRTFAMDSAQQFRPLPATPFSSQKNSAFYKEARQVYEIGLKLSDEQKEIANFWDCNPYKVNVKGHVMYATKKISPGGHWINITGLACKKAAADIYRALEAYAMVAVVLADCFISCWEEKYKSNVIRPETYINEYISADWVPLLQTPPFPEYTSGHSVVSSAASIVLTRLFGGKFSYTDSTEIEFGLPARHYQSFTDAAAEAAISRFYGGIHYMKAVINGTQQGRQIGLFVTGKIKTRD